MLLERPATPGALGALRDWLRLLTGAGGNKFGIRAAGVPSMLLRPSMARIQQMQPLSRLLLPRQAPACCRWQ